MTTMIIKIKKLADWKTILLIGIIMIIFYIFVGLFSNYLMAKTDLLEPHKVLNSIFNYSSRQAYELLTAYTDQEKDIMTKFTYPCDFIVALTYGVFLTLLLFGIYKSMIKEANLWPFMLPMIASILNIIGDILILIMFVQLNNKLVFEVIAPVSNIVNMFKLILLQVSLLVVIIGLVLLLIRKIKARSRTHASNGISRIAK